MVRDGKGGNKTSISGKAFESLYDVSKILNYQSGKKRAKDGKILSGNKQIGYYGVQREFYKVLVKVYKNQLKKIGINNTATYTKSLLKVLVPDGFCLVQASNQDVLVLFELKSQYVSGSVDEKLQSGGYKKAAFQKLVRNLGIRVEYAYITNFWYCQRQFIGVKSWLAGQRIPVFCDHENFTAWPELNKPQIDPDDQLWWNRIYPEVNERWHLNKEATKALMFERLQKFVKQQVVEIKKESLEELKPKAINTCYTEERFSDVTIAFHDFCTEKILNCNKHLLKNSKYIQTAADPENFRRVQAYLEAKLSAG